MLCFFLSVSTYFVCKYKTSIFGMKYFSLGHLHLHFLKRKWINTVPYWKVWSVFLPIKLFNKGLYLSTSSWENVNVFKMLRDSPPIKCSGIAHCTDLSFSAVPLANAYKVYLCFQFFKFSAISSLKQRLSNALPMFMTPHLVYTM